MAWRERATRLDLQQGETALRYFSILGIVVIPLLLAAGWVANMPASRIVPTCRSVVMMQTACVRAGRAMVLMRYVLLDWRRRSVRQHRGGAPVPIGASVR